MLIIPNEGTAGIRRKGRLSRPREAKENRHIATLPLIGRRVQRQDGDRCFRKLDDADVAVVMPSVKRLAGKEPAL